MEVSFTRTYVSKKKKFALGEIGAMYGYAMEITELRPRLAEGKLQPGEMMMILFGVTAEEYAMREGDEERLGEIAERVKAQYPADRLIGYVIRDLKGSVIRREVRLQIAPSIDDGAFARGLPKQGASAADGALREAARLQKAASPKDAPQGMKDDWKAARKRAAEAVLALDEIYVAYDLKLNRYPSIGFDGRVELFTNRSRAENAKRQIEGAAGIGVWTLRRVERTDVGTLLEQCEGCGVYGFRVDNGYSATELYPDDFPMEKRTVDAGVFSLMLREIQYGIRWNDMKNAQVDGRTVQGALESTLTMQNFARRELGNLMLYIIATGAFSGKACTQAAYARIGAEAKLDAAAGCIQLTDKRDGKTLIAAFTSYERAEKFRKHINMPAHTVAALFDDVAQRALGCDGISFDADDLGYRVMKGDCDKVRDLRTKPPMAVRIRAEQEEKPTEAPVSGALPDPDQFMPKREESVPHAEQEVHAEEQEPEQKPEQKPSAGIFKRLFGRKK